MSKDKKDKTSFEDLLREAKSAVNDIDSDRKAKEKGHDQSTIGKLSKQVSTMHSIFNQVASAGIWAYQNVIDPVVSSRILGWPFRTYGKLWNWAVYKDGEDGEPVFSKRNAGLLLCATLAAGFNASAIVGTTAETAWDTAWMATTTRTETWYLGKSQEIYPDANIFSTQGCETVRCSDQNSIYFRIKPSLAHHVRNLVHNGSVFYSDFVAAAIPNDTNRCEVTYYGTRQNMFVRGFNIYPQILSVECSPLSAADIEAAQPPPANFNDGITSIPPTVITPN
jgi:hypothetical protein